MCLAVPGRVTTTFEEEGVLMGKVDFGGVGRTVCLIYLPETQPGDYVIVHAGFAISRVDEAEAQQTLALLAEMNTADTERES